VPPSILPFISLSASLSLSLCLSLSLSLSCWDGTQGLTLARQALYHLATPPTPAHVSRKFRRGIFSEKEERMQKTNILVGGKNPTKSQNQKPKQGVTECHGLLIFSLWPLTVEEKEPKRMQGCWVLHL
jgi:hypothetical protein